MGIGVVLEWDPDSDLHTFKRFLPNGPAEKSGHLQVLVRIPGLFDLNYGFMDEVVIFIVRRGSAGW